MWDLFLQDKAFQRILFCSAFTTRIKLMFPFKVVLLTFIYIPVSGGKMVLLHH